MDRTKTIEENYLLLERIFNHVPKFFPETDKKIIEFERALHEAADSLRQQSLSGLIVDTNWDSFHHDGPTMTCDVGFSNIAVCIFKYIGGERQYLHFETMRTNIYAKNRLYDIAAKYEIKDMYFEANVYLIDHPIHKEKLKAIIDGEVNSYIQKDPGFNCGHSSLGQVTTQSLALFSIIGRDACLDILFRLDVADLINMMKVSRSFFKLASASKLWKRILIQKFGLQVIDQYSSEKYCCWKKIFLHHIHDPTTFLNIKFEVEYETQVGQYIYVIGPRRVIGGIWNTLPDKELEYVAFSYQRMIWTEGHKWILTLFIPASEIQFEYKYVLATTIYRILRWEGGKNRLFTHKKWLESQPDHWQE